MDYIKLNGISFDTEVAISAYKRTLNAVHGDNAGRVMSGKMILDPIAAYYGRNVTVFRRGNNYKGLDDFWDFLAAHILDDQGVLLEAADGQTTVSMRCYYSSAEQDLESVDGGINYWGPISVNFIPIDPQVTP